MKFGRLLSDSVYAPFERFYISYKELKKQLVVITKGDGRDDMSQFESSFALRTADRLTLEARFQVLLTNELDKINNFAAVQSEAMVDAARRIAAQLGSGALGDLQRVVLTLSDELMAFSKFVQLNKTGFRKICKKFDKLTKKRSMDWFMSFVNVASFADPSLVRKPFVALSIVTNVLHEKEAVSSSAVSEDTRSFLVPEESAYDISIQLLQEFRLILDGNSVDDFLNLEPLHLPETIRTVIYFDTEDKLVYSKRTAKRPDASPSGLGAAFSLRFDGKSFDPKSDADVCQLTRDRHWKLPMPRGVQKVDLSMRTVGLLYSKKLSVEKYLATAGHSREEAELIKSFTTSAKMRPSVASQFHRLTFRRESITVHVDTSVMFARPNIPGISLPSSFDRSMQNVVLTVLASTGSRDTLPLTLKTLLALPEVKEVPGFSKAVHGEAMLSEARVDLPRWLSPREGEPMSRKSSAHFDVMREYNTASLLTHELPFEQLTPLYRSPRIEEEHTFRPVDVPAVRVGDDLNDLNAPLLSTSAPRATRSLIDYLRLLIFGKKKSSEPVLEAIAEPKTYLANERTFLDWIYLCFVIVALGLAIETQNLFVGRVIQGVSVLLIFTSTIVFHDRAKRLAKLDSLESYAAGSAGAVMIASAAAVVCALILSDKLFSK